MPNLTDQRIRQKTNLEAAKKTGGISIVCRALWQSVVQTCRQRHACQPVQVAPLFQNHNHNHKTNENQHENCKVQRTKFNKRNSTLSRLFLCGVDCNHAYCLHASHVRLHAVNLSVNPTNCSFIIVPLQY